MNNPFRFLDAALERFKARHRWLQLWDRIPDQTHIHHTLVVVLFGYAWRWVAL